MTEICERCGLDYSRKQLLNLEPCQCDSVLLNAMKNAAADLELSYQTKISGAGHDAQQMSLITPVAMIFVRSEGGRSHTPDEFYPVEGCTDGIRLLAQTPYRLGYSN